VGVADHLRADRVGWYDHRLGFFSFLALVWSRMPRPIAPGFLGDSIICVMCVDVVEPRCNCVCPPPCYRLCLSHISLSYPSEDFRKCALFTKISPLEKDISES
jgi:hypothetical protein